MMLTDDLQWVQANYQIINLGNIIDRFVLGMLLAASVKIKLPVGRNFGLETLKEFENNLIISVKNNFQTII